MSDATHRLSFADTLRQLMDATGVSGTDLARALGTNKTSVSRWRSGEDLPRPLFVVGIAQHLGVDSARLLEAAGYLPTTTSPTAMLPADKAEAEWMELGRQLPTEYRSPIQEVLRLLAGQSVQQTGKRRALRSGKDHTQDQSRARGLPASNMPSQENDDQQSDNRELPALLGYLHSLLKVPTLRLSVPASPILN